MGMDRGSCVAKDCRLKVCVCMYAGLDRSAACMTSHLVFCQLHVLSCYCCSRVQLLTGLCPGIIAPASALQIT
jgi:hypothetical protein